MTMEVDIASKFDGFDERDIREKIMVVLMEEPCAVSGIVLREVEFRVARKDRLEHKDGVKYTIRNYTYLSKRDNPTVQHVWRHY